MTNKRTLSRIAGLFYLIVVITGIFSLAYVPKQLYVWDNPSQTFDNLSSREGLFRLSIALNVVCYVAFIFLPFFLYQLFHTVDKQWARLMALLAIISVPISLLNLSHKYAILDLLKVDNQLVIVNIQQEIMNQLKQYEHGVFIATLFWGLWLFPLGYLVLKSGFLPKILGILLILGCFAYLVNFFGNTVLCNYREIGIGRYLSYIPAIAEIGTCLWLLIIGVKEKTVVS